MFLHELLTVLFCEWCSNTRHIKANMSPKYSFVYVYWSGYLSPCMWTVFADDQRFISLTMFFSRNSNLMERSYCCYSITGHQVATYLTNATGARMPFQVQKYVVISALWLTRKQNEFPQILKYDEKKVVNQFGPWLLKWLDTSAEVVLITFRRYGILIRAIWVYK